jgi:hypothetical protein
MASVIARFSQQRDSSIDKHIFEEQPFEAEHCPDEATRFCILAWPLPKSVAGKK